MAISFDTYICLDVSYCPKMMTLRNGKRRDVYINSDNDETLTHYIKVLTGTKKEIILERDEYDCDEDGCDDPDNTITQLIFSQRCFKNIGTVRKNYIKCDIFSSRYRIS